MTPIALLTNAELLAAILMLNSPAYLTLSKIPFGVARKRTPCCNSFRHETVGLVIRLSDKKSLEAALAKKAESTKYKKALRPVVGA